jgi:hypothetical protein
MFAPSADRVAAELVRVCRPGGVIAMGNWTPGGFIGQMFRTISKHLAPPRMPAPVLWGDESTVRKRFREHVAQLKLERRFYRFEYPFAPEAVVEFFRTYYGPMSRAFESLDKRGQETLRAELVHLWSTHNSAAADVTKVDAEYLEVIAIRDSTAPNAHNAGHKWVIINPSQRRAESLAKRIEDGAETLAAFAEGLSDAEWCTPLSATDRRSVGVVVHHVASVYPVEIDLARAVASGKAVTDVTWAVVAELNASHAREQADVTKAEALDLLRRNSHEAANAVRAFTEDELDQAAPFSLSFGAPMTAQFVIEDHAVRHSWHHLSRIKTALNRL